MKAVIRNRDLKGTIKAIPSKSYAHRYLICGGLSGNDVDLYCPLDSVDILATSDCLHAIGAEVRRDGDYLKVRKADLRETGIPKLYCRESGSTLRFMLPIVSAIGGGFELYSEGRLPERPLSPLYEELCSHGMVISPQGKSPLCVSGKLENGVFSIPGNISSQYISGLLFALPLLEGDSELNITGPIESGSYIDLTVDCLERSGIDTGRKDESTFIIRGGQNYDLRGTYEIEGDWSNAAFFLCVSAMTDGKVAVKNLNMDSLQGDRKLLGILSDMGFSITESNGEICVHKEAPHGTVIDARNIPDIVAPLAVLACMVPGRTRIINAGRLAIKESNRLEAIGSILGSLGADIVTGNDALEIKGTGQLHGGTVDPFNDHRMVMMASIASVISDGDICIEHSEAVRKSYPGFFEDLKRLGGEVEII